MGIPVEGGKVIRLYTDAGLLSVNPSALGGVYAFAFIDDDECVTLEKSGVIDAILGYEGVITNNVAELYALAYGIMHIPAGSECGIYCDNEVAVGRVFLAQKQNGVPAWLSTMTANARLRLQNLKRFEYDFVGGHPNKKELELGRSIERPGRKGGLHVSPWNNYVDQMCKDEVTRWREANRKEVE